MCGILFLIRPSSSTNFSQRLTTLDRRGPDEKAILSGDGFIAGHTRLCITNPMSGKQPIDSEEWVVVHNGEIYNGATHVKSDSYYILDLLQKHDPEKVPEYLDGIFAYVAYNKKTGAFYAARDPIGVIPMYVAYDNESIWFSNELKALKGLPAEVVLPGTIISEKGTCRYTKAYSTKVCQPMPKNGELRRVLTSAVQKRMHLDVPWGLLLSGGLDSSIIASIVQKASFRFVKWVNMHTFSIGLQNSPDLPWARKMAESIGSHHHEYVFTIEEGIRVLRDVIYAVETYDVTTIRASVPMYILGQYVKKCGVKVLFSGEGADELFAGYLYNKSCPTAEAMVNECITKMERLHYHDCARANKSLATHGIECRVPFLDRDVVDFAMNQLPPSAKMSNGCDGNKQTKWYLRGEFDRYMNSDLRLRKKEQFSDGVGNEWIDALKAHANDNVSDDSLHDAEVLFPYQPPKTKEAFLYRKIFEELFGVEGVHTVFYTDETTACSTETANKWNETFVNDPSAKGL